MTRSMQRYDYLLSWFDDPPEDFALEARSIKRATRAVYQQWAHTGFESASVHSSDGKYTAYVDLDAPTFESAFNFDPGGRPPDYEG